MKIPAVAFLACAILACGCAPRFIRYIHLSVNESPTLKALERSTVSNDTQGKPLSGRRIGLPTKSMVTKQAYSITISTPLNHTPVVFLRAEEGKKKMARLNGPFLRELDKRSGMALEGYSYSFIVDEARGAPIAFDVVSENGMMLGHEIITYELVSRGYQWTVDAL